MPFDRKKQIVSIIAAIFVAAAVAGVLARRAGAHQDERRPSDVPATGDEPSLEMVETTSSGTLAIGTGGGSSSSTDLVEFTVEEGARKIKVICDGDNGTFGTGDIDMNVYGANDGYGPDARHKTSATGGAFEVVEFDRKDIEKRYGYGTYTVEVINFAGFMLNYDLYMRVYYPASGNGTSTEDEGGGGGNQTGTWVLLCA